MIVSRKPATPTGDPALPALDARLKALAGPTRTAPAPAPEPQQDARGNQRRTTCRFARLETGKGEPRGCIVRDASTFGVRVTIEKASELPYQVTLIDSETGARQQAYVAWRRETEAGLSFRPLRRRAAAFGKV